MKLLSRAKAGALALVPLLAACGGGGASGATGTLSVTMHDTAVEAAEAVYVTIDRVDVFQTDADGNEVEQTLVDTPQQWDLLELQNGVQAVLGEVAFPVGDYTGIRLVVAEDSKAAIEDALDDDTVETLKNYIVVDGEAHPLVVPSGAQTGVKFNHHFTISADTITGLTFDFDVRQSVHKRGNNDLYSLRPTLRLVDAVISGTVSGTVATSDSSPIPAGTVVSAQQGGVEIASAIVDVTTGAYQIGPLLEGEYDLVAIAPGYDILTETGVTVVAQTDSPGHDFLLESGDSGSIEGTVSPASDSIVVTLMQGATVIATVDGDPVTGEFAFPHVPLGMYDLFVENDGFEPQLIDGIEILVDGEIFVVDVAF